MTRSLLNHTHHFLSLFVCVCVLLCVCVHSYVYAAVFIPMYTGENEQLGRVIIITISSRCKYNATHFLSWIRQEEVPAPVSST